LISKYNLNLCLVKGRRMLGFASVFLFNIFDLTRHSANNKKLYMHSYFWTVHNISVNNIICNEWVEEVWLVGQELYYVLMEFLPLFGTRYLPCFPYLYMNISSILCPSFWVQSERVRQQKRRFSVRHRKGSDFIGHSNV
jgi:hypothetical protein